MGWTTKYWNIDDWCRDKHAIFDGLASGDQPVLDFPTLPMCLKRHPVVFIPQAFFLGHFFLGNIWWWFTHGFTRIDPVVFLTRHQLRLTPCLTSGKSGDFFLPIFEMVRHSIASESSVHLSVSRISRACFPWFFRGSLNEMVGWWIHGPFILLGKLESPRILSK